MKLTAADKPEILETCCDVCVPDSAEETRQSRVGKPFDRREIMPMPMRMLRIASLLAAFAFAASVGPAIAQPYPTKPIRFVLGPAPEGSATALVGFFASLALAMQDVC